MYLFSYILKLSFEKPIKENIILTFRLLLGKRKIIETFAL